MRTGSSQPGSDQLLFDRAVSCLQNGKLSQAERDFRALLRKQPEHPGALNLLGVLLTRLGRFADAELSTATASPPTGRNIPQLRIVLKNLERRRALRRRSYLADLNADRHPNNRRTVLTGLRRHDEAIGDFIKATSPAQICDAFNKGKSLIQTRRCLAEALAVPSARWAQPGLAEAWQGEGRLPRWASPGGNRHFGKVTALKPDYAEVYPTPRVFGQTSVTTKPLRRSIRHSG